MDVSCSLADHIQGILAGFAEQSKTSVLHMSSLYHGFLLCQVSNRNLLASFFFTYLSRIGAALDDLLGIYGRTA